LSQFVPPKADERARMRDLRIPLVLVVRADRE
jgi:hypothetical protein